MARHGKGHRRPRSVRPTGPAATWRVPPPPDHGGLPPDRAPNGTNSSARLSPARTIGSRSLQALFAVAPRLAPTTAGGATGAGRGYGGVCELEGVPAAAAEVLGAVALMCLAGPRQDNGEGSSVLGARSGSYPGGPAPGRGPCIDATRRLCYLTVVDPIGGGHRGKPAGLSGWAHSLRPAAAGRTW